MQNQGSTPPRRGWGGGTNLFPRTSIPLFISTKLSGKNAHPIAQLYLFVGCPPSAKTCLNSKQIFSIHDETLHKHMHIVWTFKEGPTLYSDSIRQHLRCNSVIGAYVGILYCDRDMSDKKPYIFFFT